MLLLPGRGVSPPQGSRAVLPLDSAQGLTSPTGTNDSFWSGEGDGKRLCQEANTRDLEANQWPETTRTRTILLQAFAAGVEAGAGRDRFLGTPWSVLCVAEVGGGREFFTALF